MLELTSDTNPSIISTVGNSVLTSGSTNQYDINFYMYTYPVYMEPVVIELHAGLWVKIGDSFRIPNIRIAEQGDANEAEGKVILETWSDITTIKRDHEIHRVLKKRGLRPKELFDGKGKEWFCLPVQTNEEAVEYIKQVMDEIGGEGTGSHAVHLRPLQKTKLTQSLDTIYNNTADGNSITNIVANLCPRFGKTLWALELFNNLAKLYNHRIMVLPAYWLSVYKSFSDEIKKYREFIDIEVIKANEPNAEEIINNALQNNKRVVVELSLHGQVDTWKTKYGYLRNFINYDMFMFSDEADFGSHGSKQIEKLQYIFEDHSSTSHLVKVFASGTNIQRIANNAGVDKIHDYVDAAYSEMEELGGVVKRKYYMLQFAGLFEALKESNLPNAFTADNIPNWSAIWANPNKCQQFLSTQIRAMLGREDHLSSLNLSVAAGEEINSLMIWTSADNKQLTQLKKIYEKAIPDYAIVVLSGGEDITNFVAQDTVELAMNTAKKEGKVGIIVIANQMGSRSFSVPEIQATIIMYDNGSVDALFQKTSRSLTPGKTWNGEDKEFGYTFVWSYDGNRAENIENLVLYESITLSRSEEISFNNALKRVCMTVNIFRVDVNGDPEFVPVDELIKTFSEDDNILKVADVTIDMYALINSSAYDIVMNIKSGTGTGTKFNDKSLSPLVPKRTNPNKKDKDVNANDLAKEIKEIEKRASKAIRTINRSATTVYNLANGGDNFRECLDIISKDKILNAEFMDFYTVSPSNVIQLVDENILNIMLLDIVVENSKVIPNWFN